MAAAQAQYKKQLVELPGLITYDLIWSCDNTTNSATNKRTFKYKVASKWSRTSFIEEINRSSESTNFKVDASAKVSFLSFVSAAGMTRHTPYFQLLSRV